MSNTEEGVPYVDPDSFEIQVDQQGGWEQPIRLPLSAIADIVRITRPTYERQRWTDLPLGDDK